jgi:YrbI family 3-deoxy-D-manno-octulosonate 8-phosphate phosphatase
MNLTPTIAVIPARGGSKGLPRKNLLPLCGRPLIAWNILAALEACGADNVYVTTDDAEIREISIQHGARVIMRPAELANDTASSEAALLHALGAIQEEREQLPESFLFLQCTSPLTTSQDLRQVMDLMEQGGIDTAFSATSSHRFLWRESTGREATGINHDSKFRHRRQDREPEFSENGAIYAMKTAGFLNHKHRFFGKTAIHVMPEERSWEIDSLTDFKVAEVLLRSLLQEERQSLIPRSLSAVVFDFDGVMTDNRVHTDQHGTERVVCDRSDGMGLAALRNRGIKLLVLSTEENPVVAARCAKLKIPCIQAIEDKGKRLKQWMKDESIVPAHVMYVGNDRNDNNCLEIVGCPVVVADAYPEAQQRALIVLDKNGGQGAVREVCDLILNQIE